MNIIFFGSSEFAIPALRKLIDSRHKVSALVTQPDRKKGRALKLSPPPTKVLALSRNIPVFQPQDASGAESVEYLKKIGADLFVVVAFGQILKKTLVHYFHLWRPIILFIRCCSSSTKWKGRRDSRRYWISLKRY